MSFQASVGANLCVREILFGAGFIYRCSDNLKISVEFVTF